ncbi:pyridoxamine 5'-phosphate oxidase [Thermophagus sp. OGC60D27]|uniref:pyridoxamine 5'-phosphate oxidase n=1 Tax=Thermophagus sp. OGC60D27 TaxID=3458415 RepID=UPI0040378B77
MQSKFQHIRKNYGRYSLDRDHLHPLPMKQLMKWMNEAVESEQTEPTAMSLASVDASGQPSQRIVLMKGITERGISFYTNYHSRKGNHFQHHPKASVLFFWPLMERQVRMEGIVEKLPATRSDEYFSTRPRESQIGAWASPQSEMVSNRKVLEEQFNELETRFQGQPVPRPPHWGGYLFTPHRIEFWQGGANRMHDRFEYSLTQDGWIVRRLAP